MTLESGLECQPARGAVAQEFELPKGMVLEDEQPVFHITLDGGRGVDYKMNEPALVIIAKEPSNLSEYRQFAGRGCRRTGGSLSTS